MSAPDQSAQTKRTDGTDGTVQERVYAVPLKGGEVLFTRDPPTQEVRMCFKAPEKPSENATGWNPSTLPQTASIPPTLYPVTRQLVSQADDKVRTEQSGSKR